jgi:alpha-ketoglutarate-dependent taurine dioxygenase
MNISDVQRGERAATITWADRSVTEYPFIWLRDNDPNELHPDTQERIFDLTSVDLDISPDSLCTGDGELIVQWPDRTEPSLYIGDWLFRHRPGGARHDPSCSEQTLWNRETMTDLPRVDAADCRRSPDVLKDALLTAKRFGLLIIEGLEDNLESGEAFGDLIGFKRESNFGVMFEVISKPDPNNLAYTSMALPLHTDLPNQDVIPGYQFVHSYRNGASGGENVFADGFRICADLAKEQPQEFELLKSVEIPWRFHDESCDIRRHRPIISQRADGDFDAFVFNAHIADLPDMETDALYDFYAAYRNLMIRVRDPLYAVHCMLAPGEMAMFDNTRILHGRTAFDPSSGDRHLRGYYIEKNEVDSRIRVLSREKSQELA